MIGFDVSSVLLVGGAGHLGRVLNARLGFGAVTFDRRPLDSSSQNSTFGDLLDPKSVKRAIYGSSAVVHLAALHGPDIDAGATNAEVRRSNVEGTQILVKAAEWAGVRRLIFVSTTSVYRREFGGPVSENAAMNFDDVYSRSKLDAEEILAESSLTTNVLRAARFTFPDYSSRLCHFLRGAIDIEDLASFIRRILVEDLDTGGPLNVVARSPLAPTRALSARTSGMGPGQLSTVELALRRRSIFDVEPVRRIVVSDRLHRYLDESQMTDFWKAAIESWEVRPEERAWYRPSTA